MPVLHSCFVREWILRPHARGRPGPAEGERAGYPAPALRLSPLLRETFASGLWRCFFPQRRCLSAMHWRRLFERCPQLIIDACLPTRATCLELLDDVPIEPQIDRLLGVSQRRPAAPDDLIALAQIGACEFRPPFGCRQVRRIVRINPARLCRLFARGHWLFSC